MKSFGNTLNLLTAILILTLAGSCTKEGSQQSGALLPQVETTSVTNITATTAQTGGGVSDDGGSAVTARGVCWGTSPMPTTSSSKSTDGVGKGGWISNLSGLTAGTTYFVRAYAVNQKGTSYGNQLTFTTPSADIKYEKNVLLEQYTGTWCGYCTRAIAQIDYLLPLDKKVVHMALHLNDVMTFNLNSSLFSSFGFTGVPTVHADRAATWTGSVSVISAMHAPANAGLAIEVLSSGTTVTANVRVQFGTNFPDGVKLSIYLLESGIVANQSNYYNTDNTSPFYNKGNPIPNFVHNNVLTKIGTDMFGDLIPSASVGAGKTYAKSVNFTNIASDKMSKIKVVAFVTYAGGANNKKVVNCIEGSVGNNKDFVVAN